MAHSYAYVCIIMALGLRCLFDLFTFCWKFSAGRERRNTRGSTISALAVGKRALWVITKHVIHRSVLVRIGIGSSQRMWRICPFHVNHLIVNDAKTNTVTKSNTKWQDSELTAQVHCFHSNAITKACHPFTDDSVFRIQPVVLWPRSA